MKLSKIILSIIWFGIGAAFATALSAAFVAGIQSLYATLCIVCAFIRAHAEMIASGVAWMFPFVAGSFCAFIPWPTSKGGKK
jgi:hypothetical protein